MSFDNGFMVNSDVFVFQAGFNLNILRKFFCQKPWKKSENQSRDWCWDQSYTSLGGRDCQCLTGYLGQTTQI